MRNMPVKLFRIQTSGMWWPLCVHRSRTVLCNYGLLHYEEFFSELILDLGQCFFVCFLFDSLRPSQHFFSHVWKGLPVLNQY